MLLDDVERNVRAACLPFPMETHKTSSGMNAFGQGFSVIGGWRLGEIDVFVLEVQPFYFNWQF